MLLGSSLLTCLPARALQVARSRASLQDVADEQWQQDYCSGCCPGMSCVLCNCNAVVRKEVAASEVIGRRLVDHRCYGISTRFQNTASNTMSDNERDKVSSTALAITSIYG